MGEWISIREKLPPLKTLVLCVGSKGGMFLGEAFCYTEGSEYTQLYMCVPNSRNGRRAVYWMPLPEPPKA